MNIPGFFKKTGLILAFAAALAGCGKTIGPKAETPDLRGETSITQVFNGGPQGNMTRISGAALQAKESYQASGKIIIEGDVPAKSSIDVDAGKLLVTGNVGDGASIHVSQPIKTHNENYPDFCYGYDFMAGKFKYSYKFSGCDHTVVDGLKYNDAEAAVEIKGNIGKDVKISTPGKIIVNGQQLANKHQMAPAGIKKAGS